MVTHRPHPSYESYPKSHPYNKGGWERRIWLTLVAGNGTLSRRYKSPGRLTMDGLRELRHWCWYCDQALEAEDAHASYLVPLRLGGLMSDLNVRWTHYRCFKKYRREALKGAPTPTT